MPEVIVDYKPLWLVLLVSSNTLLLSSLLAVLLLAHLYLNSSLGAQLNLLHWPVLKMDEDETDRIRRFDFLKHNTTRT